MLEVRPRGPCSNETFRSEGLSRSGFSPKMGKGNRLRSRDETMRTGPDATFDVKRCLYWGRALWLPMNRAPETSNGGLMKITKKWLVDVVERAASTYVEVFAGLLLASWADMSAAVTRMAVVDKAALAAVPAALAVIKGAVAQLKGDPDSASLA